VSYNGYYETLPTFRPEFDSLRLHNRASGRGAQPARLVESKRTSCPPCHVGTAKVGAIGLGFSSESTLVPDVYGVSTKPGFNSSGPRWYNDHMRRSIICEFCSVSLVSTSGNQRACTKSACKRKLRAQTRAVVYYNERPPPICVWCEKPIYEPRKRKYHTECRAEKNRQRVKDYNKIRKPSSVPKKSRKFKSHLVCKYCRKRVKRTSARQFACVARECRSARKKEAKDRSQRRIEQRERAVRREEGACLKRIEELRAEKRRRVRLGQVRTPPPEEYSRITYRVVVG
jgi:hypothetical protein